MAGESIEGPYAVVRDASGDERVARGWRLTGLMNFAWAERGRAEETREREKRK